MSKMSDDEQSLTPLIFASDNGGPTPTRGLQFETLSDLHADKLNPFDAAFRSENTAAKSDQFTKSPNSKNSKHSLLKPDSPILNVVDDDDPSPTQNSLSRCNTLPLADPDEHQLSGNSVDPNIFSLSMMKSISGSSELGNLLKSDSLINSISQFAHNLVSSSSPNKLATSLSYTTAVSSSSSETDPKILSVSSVMNKTSEISNYNPSPTNLNCTSSGSLEPQVLAYMPNGFGQLIPMILPLSQLNAANPSTSMNVNFEDAATLPSGTTSPVQLGGVTSTSNGSDKTQSSNLTRAFLRQILKRKLGESDDSSISDSPQPGVCSSSHSRSIMVDCDVESNDCGPSLNSLPSDTTSADPRKERNRIAARKCRDKKKTYIKQLEKKVANWEAKYKSLETKYQNMKNDNQILRQLFNNSLLQIQSGGAASDNA